MWASQAVDAASERKVAGAAISYVNTFRTVKELSESMASSLPAEPDLPAALERHQLRMTRNHAQFLNLRTQEHLKMLKRMPKRSIQGCRFLAHAHV